jgi:hypothetical protein
MTDMPYVIFKYYDKFTKNMPYGFLHLNSKIIDNMIMISKHYNKSENKAFIIKYFNT